MSEIPRIASISTPSSTQESGTAGNQSASVPQHQEREKESLSPFARFKKTCTPFGNKLRWLTRKKNTSGADVPSAQLPPADDGRAPQFPRALPLQVPHASNEIPFSNDPGVVHPSAAQAGHGQVATQKPLSPVPTEPVTIKTEITHASDQVRRQELRPPYPDLVVLRGDLLKILNLLDDETYEPPLFVDPNMIASATPTKAEVNRGDSDSLKTHTGAGSDSEVDRPAHSNPNPRPIPVGDVKNSRPELKQYIANRFGNAHELPNQNSPIMRPEMTTVSRNPEIQGPRPMPPTWATTTDLKPIDTSRRLLSESGQRSSTLKKLSNFVQNPLDAINLAKRRRQAAPTIVIPSRATIPTSDTDGLRSAMKSTTSKERKTVSFAPPEHTASDSDEEK